MLTTAAMRFPRFAPALLAALLLVPACDNGKKEPTPEEIAAKLASDLEDAAAHLRNHKEADAEKIYERILEDDAENATAIGGLGRVRLEQKRYDDAEALLVRATAKTSDDPVLFAALGEARQLTGKHAEAAEAYGKAVEIAPDNSSYGLFYGRELNKAEQFAKAEEVLRKVEKDDPKAPSVNTLLGDALRGQDKLDEALRTYMKAQNVNRSDKGAHAGAAFIYETKGDNKHALDEWSSYIRQDCCSDFSKSVAHKKIETLGAGGGGEPSEEVVEDEDG